MEIHNPRGINNKPADLDTYCLPISIFSQDENARERRCGILSFCRKINDAWIGFTVFQLFTDTWTPNSLGTNPDRPLGYDPKANVVGKQCYQFEWTTSRTKDITTDHNLMKNVRRIGVVVRGMPENNLLAIRLDPDFVSTSLFQNEGFWGRYPIPLGGLYYVR